MPVVHDLMQHLKHKKKLLVSCLQYNNIHFTISKCRFTQMTILLKSAYLYTNMYEYAYLYAVSSNVLSNEAVYWLSCCAFPFQNNIFIIK